MEIKRKQEYKYSLVPVWFIENRINEAESKSEMEYVENGGYLDGNIYFYEYCGLRSLIDDWHEFVQAHEPGKEDVATWLRERQKDV